MQTTAHAPGTFCWLELATTDVAGAKQFYRALLDWETQDVPAGEMTYTLAKRNGRDVGGIYTLQAEQRQQGVPSHWMTYISVASVDEAAQKAQSLGATVFAPPFDVMEIGRMAVIQDPQGATFALWQPKTHIGFGIINEPGSHCWSELNTTDTQAAGRFYRDLFGWGAKEGDMGAAGTYTEWRHDGRSIGGMMTLPAQAKAAGAPPHWLNYFAVEDCDARAAKASSLGGKLLVPPMDIPNVGRFAIIQDPQGAVFAIYKSAH